MPSHTHWRKWGTEFPSLDAYATRSSDSEWAALEPIDEPEDRMTLIACSRQPDGSFLLAADSGVATEEGLILIEQKLAFRTDAPVAWGFAGDEALGRQFDDWMMSLELVGWPQLVESIANEVARLNARRRELWVRSGLDLNDLRSDQLLSVIVCGFIGGLSLAGTFDDKGGREIGVRPLFLGGGAVVGHIAMLTLGAYGVFEFGAEPFRRLMLLVVQMGKGLREPVRILHVTADGVQEY